MALSWINASVHLRVGESPCLGGITTGLWTRALTRCRYICCRRCCLMSVCSCPWGEEELPVTDMLQGNPQSISVCNPVNHGMPPPSPRKKPCRPFILCPKEGVPATTAARQNRCLHNPVLQSGPTPGPLAKQCLLHAMMSMQQLGGFCTTCMRTTCPSHPGEPPLLTARQVTYGIVLH
jgi:hypothetical protein